MVDAPESEMRENVIDMFEGTNVLQRDTIEDDDKLSQKLFTIILFRILASSPNRALAV